MRLRSIPPRTMGTLTTRSSGTILPQGITQFRQRCTKLEEDLQGLGKVNWVDTRPFNPFDGTRTAFRPKANTMTFGKQRPGVPSWRTASRPDTLLPERRIGARPDTSRVMERIGARQPIDFLIPPRPVHRRGRTTQVVLETADYHIVSLTFPVPIRIDEVNWALHEDVLEVEYLGPAFTYSSAFLVPTDSEPVLELSGQTLTFRFPRRA